MLSSDGGYDRAVLTGIVKHSVNFKNRDHSSVPKGAYQREAL